MWSCKLCILPTLKSRASYHIAINCSELLCLYSSRFLDSCSISPFHIVLRAVACVALHMHVRCSQIAEHCLFTSCVLHRQSVCHDIILCAFHNIDYFTNSFVCRQFRLFPFVFFIFNNQMKGLQWLHENSWVDVYNIL